MVFKKYTVFKRKLFFFNIICFSLILFLIFSVKIDSITLDPDPNWYKILDPDQNSCIWIHNTAGNTMRWSTVKVPVPVVKGVGHLGFVHRLRLVLEILNPGRRTRR